MQATKVIIPVSCRGEARLVVPVGHGRHVAANHLVLIRHVLADVVDRHFEHAQVHVGNGREGTACDEDQGRFGRVRQHANEPVRGEVVVFKGLDGREGHFRVLGRWWEGGGGWWEEEGGWWWVVGGGWWW